MRITIMAFPRVQFLDVIGPADVFAEAARQLGQPRAYRIEVISAQAGLLKASNGLPLHSSASYREHKGRIDTLLVAGSPYIEELNPDSELLAWLREQSTRVRRIGSVCSGAFLLAAAGLLEGRRVTTHWRSSARLARRYPGIRLESDSIYIKDDNIYTSAGVTAEMDLALAMVEEDHGKELALKVARELVMFFKRPGGQAQFSHYLAAQSSERSIINSTIEHIQSNLDKPLSVAALAGLVGMSERNFARVFKSEVGQTPGEFVELARLDLARRLLEETELPLKRLAGKVGYDSLDSFRRAFVRRFSATPSDYRQRFASTTE